MTRLHAVRVAAQMKRELGVDVKVLGGPYGTFEVLVDGTRVLNGGRLAALGVLPSAATVIATVREHMAQPGAAPS